jgi:DNA invertase Pin-like site-specific DNA recombinase
MTTDTDPRTAPMLIGYARCSTDKQDLTAQKTALAALGVAEDRIYLDHGLTGTNRNRPARAQALAAVRKGDTLAVTKLDRLARSVPDALDIIGQLSESGVRFALGGSVYDWEDSFARMFLTILAVIAEFEGNLIRQRTREGMARPSVRAKLKGKPPKLSPPQQKHLVDLHGAGEHSIGDLSELFGVSRPTVYRTLRRCGAIGPGGALAGESATAQRVRRESPEPSRTLRNAPRPRRGPLAQQWLPRSRPSGGR